MSSTAQYQTFEAVEDDMLTIAFSMVDSSGNAVNITGYALALQVMKPTGDVLEKTGTITNAASGQASFTFGASDLNFTGLCDAQLKVTDSASATTRIRGFGLRIFPKFK